MNKYSVFVHNIEHFIDSSTICRSSYIFAINSQKGNMKTNTLKLALVNIMVADKKETIVEMLKRLNEIEKMYNEDKGSILKVLDGFIKSVKLKNIAAL